MLVIGLTGGIGSGKSTVADLFAQKGAPIVDADAIAKQVTQIGTPALAAISERFGPDILMSDGSLDRGKLRTIIFDSPEERRWLEALLHPIILDQMKLTIPKLDAPYCIAVIPLLMETDSNSFIQRTLVVDVPEEAQLKRAILRDKTTEDRIKSILKTQMPRDQRLAQADDVIDNSGSTEDLLTQVEKLHQTYLQLGQEQRQ